VSLLVVYCRLTIFYENTGNISVLFAISGTPPEVGFHCEFFLGPLIESYGANSGCKNLAVSNGILLMRPPVIGKMLCIA
jgi:hypothetical protein